MDESTNKGWGSSDYHSNGRGWGGGWIIIIIIIIIIICICWWWWSNSRNDKDFHGKNGLDGTTWQGRGSYAGTKQNNNLQEDCFDEWVELKFLGSDKGYGKKCADNCVRVEVNFKIVSKGHKDSRTRARGSFRAVGVIGKHGEAHLTTTQGQGELTLRFHDDHSLEYIFTEYNNARGTGEKGVTKAHLKRIVKHGHY